MLRRILPSSRCRQPLLTAHQSQQLRFQAIPPRRNLTPYDSFLSGTSGMYVEREYFNWKKDPASVDPSFAEVFENAGERDFDEGLLDTDVRPVSTSSSSVGKDAVAENAPALDQGLRDSMRLLWLVQAFEERGHLLAAIDPLKFQEREDMNRSPRSRYAQRLARLDLEYFGFTKEYHNRQVSVAFTEKLGGLLGRHGGQMTLKELHNRLRNAYCGTVGYEFLHVENDDACLFFRDSIETGNVTGSHLHAKFSNEERKAFLTSLGEAVMFEDLLARKYGTKKRFGLDGGEAFVLALSVLLEQSTRHGVQHAVAGMAHRGRLNALVHIFGKPVQAVLKEFKGVKQEELLPYRIQSDVKYHLGYASERSFGTNKQPIRAELLSNPSHLETVNPIVQGKAKGLQDLYKDSNGTKVLPIEVHGDAAIAGQGVVYETMAISLTNHFHTGGTIHIVVNNQIGFTTDPLEGRSSAWCTDLARTFQTPVIHVNGDHPEEVVRVMRFAAEYRARFHSSIIIDLVCYRRYGHNESDVPSLTQPALYRQIDDHPDIFTLYGKSLIDEGVISNEEFQGIRRDIRQELNVAYDEVDKKGFNYSEFLSKNIPPQWKKGDGIVYSDGTPELYPTAVSASALSPVIDAINRTPHGFQVHPTLGKIFDRRKHALEIGKGIDWGTAEALAFGALLEEGYPIHLQGEDVIRGTFSHRHAGVMDQNTGHTYFPLAHISDNQAKLMVHNSILSEYGALGYEVGYSTATPKQISMWEAQFGDFANTAQIIFDQYISAGETKYNTQYAPIVSMPHGADGQGPEHSSGRIERFLQFVSEDEASTPLDLSKTVRLHDCNIEITYLTTPAQYFHLIRRHVRRNFRKPLINFFSKAFLREVTGTNNTSTLEEMTGEGTQFQELIEDTEVKPAEVRRVVFVTGQLYHKLYVTRKAANLEKSVALVRIEQLAPFPFAEVAKVLKDYPTQELVFAQEEPQNQGPWWYVQARLDRLTEGKREVQFAGRVPAAAPATGFKYAYDYEQDHLLKDALGSE